MLALLSWSRLTWWQKMLCHSDFGWRLMYNRILRCGDIIHSTRDDQIALRSSCNADCSTSSLSTATVSIQACSLFHHLHQPITTEWSFVWITSNLAGGYHVQFGILAFCCFHCGNITFASNNAPPTKVSDHLNGLAWPTQALLMTKEVRNGESMK